MHSKARSVTRYTRNNGHDRPDSSTVVGMDPAKKSNQKVFVKFVYESDIQAHTYIDAYLYKLTLNLSKNFRTLTIRDNGWMALNSDDEQNRGQSFLEKYQNRPFDSVAIFDDQMSFSQISYKPWPDVSSKIIADGIKTERIQLLVFPKSKPNLDATRKKACYRQQVLLHVLWTNEHKNEDSSLSYIRHQDGIPN